MGNPLLSHILKIFFFSKPIVAVDSFPFTRILTIVHIIFNTLIYYYIFLFISVFSIYFFFLDFFSIPIWGLLRDGMVVFKMKLDGVENYNYGILMNIESWICFYIKKQHPNNALLKCWNLTIQIRNFHK